MLPAPFQHNNLLADVLLQPADQIEISEYLFFELPESGPTFGWQNPKSRIDPVLESRRNSLVIFAHGGALQKRLIHCRLQEASSLEGDSLPQTHAGKFGQPTQRDRLKIFYGLLYRDARF